ncbi:Aldehyde dehydrogenase [Enhygromyxa salina]|uniref:Aldehyde dehydrogenase n=1 Tax=Enhygromyxa salina TaxID=215803 RepID=A0A0C1ZLU2_9BACT|nr:aldehyde dehydrogenase family protein [Enhygromyxa salina]KIG18489.1 Aldehyde dehydrogenase [Enhygromyxa salina]
MPDGTARPSSTLPPIECHDPATLERLGEVEVMDRAQVEAIIARARAAQPRWAATSFAERRAVLRDLLAWIVEHQANICHLAARDSGKTLIDAAMGEVFPVCEKLRYTIAHGERDLSPEPRSPGFLLHKRGRVEYLPFGVVAVIAPWNFPFHNIYCPLIPALFAGNAVVVKVSEWTSWSASEYLEIIHRVLRKHGLPTDLVQVVTGWGETGAHLVRGGVDKVFFTGSPGNGRKVMATASDDLTPVVLELGGKDPLIVCDDANLDQAADAAMLGVFTACGQMCVGAERIYVFDAVHDQFVETMRARVAALRQGPPLTNAIVDCGATTMPAQLEVISTLVDDALERGATALVGGRRNPELAGQYYEPTLLVGVDHSMRITQEEVFGPIMVVIRVRDEAEAVRLANDCPYGLGSSVFTRDRARGQRIARQLRTGMTVVNDYGVAYMMQALPFGGVGNSGFGRINGPEGLRACCYAKAIVEDRVPLGRSVAFHPVRPYSYELVQSAVRIIYSRGLQAKARAVVGAARTMLSTMQGARDDD